MLINFRQRQPEQRSALFALHHFVIGFMLTMLLISACQPLQPPSSEQVISAPGSQQPATPLYAERGPFGVGYRLLVSGAGSERPLEIHSWYPALIPTGEKEEIQYAVKLKDATWSPGTPPVVDGRALLDAAPDDSGGRHPLVVFSHGFILSPVWYNTLAEHFASYGFIVLAPEHTEQFDPTFGDMWKALIDRPDDVKRTLDYAEELTAPAGELAGLIDMEHVAVVGHSYGGYTALAVAGAQYDWAAYKARCAQLADEDPLAFFCLPIVPHEADMAARAGLDAVPDGLWPSFGDPRVTAFIAMAGDSYLFDQAGLSNITIPMMAIGGSADTGTPPDWGIEPAYEFAASDQKALVTLKGAEHMIFTTPCENQPWLRDHPFYEYFCFDPAWDKAQALDLIHHFSTAFLLDALKGDAAAHASLVPEAVQFSGIDYKTTLQ